jgi:hypothetical protein
MFELFMIAPAACRAGADADPHNFEAAPVFFVQNAQAKADGAKHHDKFAGSCWFPAKPSWQSGCDALLFRLRISVSKCERGGICPPR